MDEIKFGTDGWRGVIAEDYTFENVRRVAGAIAAYVLKNEDPSRGLVIGYDTRYGSRRFAQAAAEVLAAAGISIKLSNDYTPTPALSYAVRSLKTAGGIMITSSHNPWDWNGVKFKATYGGSATPAIIKQIEGYVREGAMPKGKAAKVEEAISRRPMLTRSANLPIWTRSQKPTSSLPSTACMARDAMCWQTSSRSAESSMCRFAVR